MSNRHPQFWEIGATEGDRDRSSLASSKPAIGCIGMCANYYPIGTEEYMACAAGCLREKGLDDDGAGSASDAGSGLAMIPLVLLTVVVMIAALILMFWKG